MTDYLQVVIETTRPYDAAIAAIREVIVATGSSRILDLASGAGGPWRHLVARWADELPALHVTLTDIAPHASAVDRFGSVDGITYLPEPVSALELPHLPHGIRTMFTALHHFDADEIRSIFLEAQRDRVGFAAFEATQRSIRGLLMTLAIPLLVLVLMPRVRPVRTLPLVLTYLPPLLPLLIWWDGLASTLRTYSVAELRALVEEIAEPHYAWEVRELPVRKAPIPMLQVIGRPLENQDP